jgi:hypothetical protein
MKRYACPTCNYSTDGGKVFIGHLLNCCRDSPWIWCMAQHSERKWHTNFRCCCGWHGRGWSAALHHLHQVGLDRLDLHQTEAALVSAGRKSVIA